MNFPKIKQWLKESEQDKVTVMIPGGFKPTTGAHLDLITRYSRNPDVKEVRVIVGPKTRNGIDQELGVKIAKELTSHLPNVKVETSKYPSPLLTAYKEIENLKPGRYALGASSKGDDYKRVVDFTEQHQPGGKYYEGVPEGVSIEELAVNADPALFLDGPHKGQPISASTLRADVMEGDYEAFATGYPLNDEKQIKKVWNMLQDVVINESYTYGYINEAAISSGKNTHMTHAEDLVILGGKEGMDWVLKMMWDLYEDLKGHTEKEDMKLSVKIDGAPAIFAWSSFPDLPDYGIAMKGLFAKTPKVFTNDKEIDENFGDRPSLGYKLKTFLKYLKDIKIPAGEIWQGDFLFDDKSIQETEIDGEPHWAFHPNTIYYVVPKDSDLGKLIDKAEVGITWHTRYTGPDLESVQANYDTDASELQMLDKLLMTDPYIRSFAGLVNFTEEESNNVEETLEELLEISKNLGNSSAYKKLLESKDIISLFTIFQNSLIKDNVKMSKMDPDMFIQNFLTFIHERLMKEVDKRKSEKGRENIMEKFAGMMDFIEQNKDEMYMLVHMITEITRLKEMFVNKLSKIGQFQTYLKMKEGGLRGTNQEGFAISDMYGDVVKLVDRGEFSWSNFSPEVVKGWQPS